MKNCKNIFLISKSILWPCSPLTFQKVPFPVSAVYKNFQGTFLNFFVCNFSMSEFAGFKNIYLKTLTRIQSLKALADFSAKNREYR